MSTTGFQRALDHIRSISETQVWKGRLFERGLVPAIERLIHASVEIERVVAGLPGPMPVELAEFTIDLGEWQTACV